MKYLVQPLLSDSNTAPTRNKGKWVVLSSINSGLALTERDGDIVLEQRMWKENTSQQWRFEQVGSNEWKIVCRKNDRVIDIRAASTADGADAITWTWHGGPNQRFRITDLGDGRLRLDAVHSGKSLDVRGASISEGHQVIQWPWHGGKNQQWMASEVFPASALTRPQATLYQHADYQGISKSLGIGSYSMAEMGIPNDQLSSVRVPSGLQVTLYEHANFRGNKKVLTADNRFVSDFNDITSSVVVEQVVTAYQHRDYGGMSAKFGVGVYNISEIGIPNDSLSSIRVPFGLQVTVYEHADFKGRRRIYNQDTPWVEDFNDIASSIVVKQTGVSIPADSLRFGSKISLKGAHGKWVVAESNGDLNANRTAVGDWEKFEIIRSGTTRHLSHVSFGDVISLKSAHGAYVVAESDGRANANRTAVGDYERFVVVRSGRTEHNSFVTAGDQVSLLSVHKTYLCAESDGRANWNRQAVGDWERFVLTNYEPKPIMNGAETSVCGAALCGANACVEDACGVDACGAALCGAQAMLINACGAAANALALCGMDAAGIAACGGNVAGIAACGGNVAGVAACGLQLAGISACGGNAAGVAFCGADVCGAAACAGAACGAAGCVAAACGAAACGGDACGAQIDLGGCPVDVCGANACGVDACPFDACGADACAIDVIPVIPGI